MLPASVFRGLIVIPLAAALGCPGPAAAPPAAGEKPKVEADLSRTTLSAEPCQSLGIRSEPVRAAAQLHDHLPLTGWVMPRPGHEVTITAPWPGYVRAPKETIPAPGMSVRAGQELWSLEPVLSAVEQIQMASLKRIVESDLAKAKERVGVAEKELQRLEDLHRQKLRSDQDVEQARARLNHAKEDLAAAEDKRKLFPNGDGPSDHLGAVAIPAPRGGRVLTVPVTPGQSVAAAAPLVTLAALDHVRLPVPVPEESLPRITDDPATVVLRGAVSGRFEARRPNLVPQVDLARHTADMIYELDAPSAHLAKDQMVSVLVPLDEKRDECLVPYSAVVFDAFGGSWVYVDLTPAGAAQHLYERRRVELGPAIGDDVVVRPVLPSSARIVVEGAAVLFSREFHKPPVK